MKRAVGIIARDFGVSYQHAKTRIQKAIAEGAIDNITVVRARVNPDTWLMLGFKLVWVKAARAKEAGLRGPEVAALPGRSLVAFREGPHSLHMFLPPDSMAAISEVLASVEYGSGLEL